MGFHISHNFVLVLTQLSLLQEIAHGLPQARSRLASSRNSLGSILWPFGVVKYQIADSFESDHVRTIKDAMKGLEEVSGVQFVERQSSDWDGDFVDIRSDSGGHCWSHVGRLASDHPNETNIINLVPIKDDPVEEERCPGCLTLEEVTRQLLHTLGFFNEHERPDRDDFVAVNWANIEYDSLHNFVKALPNSEESNPSLPVCKPYFFPEPYDDCFNGNFINTNNTCYDLKSILHYDPYKFGKHSLIPTLFPRDNSVPLEDIGGHKLSPGDIYKLNLHYPKSEFDPSKNPCQQRALDSFNSMIPMHYFHQDSDCMKISTPGYSQGWNYTAGLRMSWIFKNMATKTCKLKMTIYEPFSIPLDKSTKCRRDFLYLLDDNNKAANTWRSRLCGEGPQPEIEFEKYEASVIFHADAASDGGKGFQATICPVCKSKSHSSIDPSNSGP